jgi:hypothetical protein
MKKKPYNPLNLTHFCSGNCPTCVAKAEARANRWRNFWFVIVLVAIVGGFTAAMLKVHSEAQKAELWYLTQNSEMTTSVVDPADDTQTAPIRLAPVQEEPFWAKPGFDPNRDYPRRIIAPEDK